MSCKYRKTWKTFKTNLKLSSSFVFFEIILIQLWRSDF